MSMVRDQRACPEARPGRCRRMPGAQRTDSECDLRKRCSIETRPHFVLMPQQATHLDEEEGSDMSIKRWRTQVGAAALSAVAAGIFAATAAATPPANTA